MVINLSMGLLLIIIGVLIFVHFFKSMIKPIGVAKQGKKKNMKNSSVGCEYCSYEGFVSLGGINGSTIPCPKCNSASRHFEKKGKADIFSIR